MWVQEHILGTNEVRDAVKVKVYTMMHGQKNIKKAVTCANCMSSGFTATLSSNTTALVWCTDRVKN
jgi:hypothetical protein